MRTFRKTSRRAVLARRLSRERPRAATLTVTGFVDISTSQGLIDAGSEVLASGRPLVVDLSGVDFMDAAGVNALITLAAAAQRADRTFEVSAVSARVARVLQLTGLEGRWPSTTAGPSSPSSP